MSKGLEVCSQVILYLRVNACTIYTIYKLPLQTLGGERKSHSYGDSQTGNQQKIIIKIIKQVLSSSK